MLTDTRPQKGLVSNKKKISLNQNNMPESGNGIASAAIGSGIDQVGNYVSAYLANEANTQARDDQNKFNENAVMNQNRYNHPAQQMARFKEAGLNPNLIYGQGNAGNQPSAVRTEAVQKEVPRFNFGDRIMQAFALETQAKQQALLSANIQKTNMQAMTEVEKAASLRQGTYNATLDAVLKRVAGTHAQAGERYAGELAGYNTAAKRQQLVNMVKDLDLKNIQGTNMKVDNSIKQQILQEKAYFNNMMKDSGITKNDNIIYRGGYNLYKQGQDWWKKNFK